MTDMIFAFLKGNSTALSAVVLALLPFALPNPWVKKTCYGVGKGLSLLLCQKIGKGPGEKVESYFQGTIAAAVEGLNEGLDADDKEK